MMYYGILVPVDSHFLTIKSGVHSSKSIDDHTASLKKKITMIISYTWLFVRMSHNNYYNGMRYYHISTIYFNYSMKTILYHNTQNGCTS